MYVLLTSCQSTPIQRASRNNVQIIECLKINVSLSMVRKYSTRTSKGLSIRFFDFCCFRPSEMVTLFESGTWRRKLDLVFVKFVGDFNLRVIKHCLNCFTHKCICRHSFSWISSHWHYAPRSKTDNCLLSQCFTISAE